MTFTSSGKGAEFSVRCDRDLRDALESASEQTGKPMAEIIREALRSELEQYSDDDSAEHLPEDDDLRQAYRQLLKLSRGGRDQRVKVEVAETALASKFSTSSGLIRDLYLKPLERLDWLVVRSGQLYVRGANRTETESSSDSDDVETKMDELTNPANREIEAD